MPLFPALVIAAGQLALPAALRPACGQRRVDIVHTELCTLHLDPSDHSAEQCVVQSLFADGFVRYALRDTEALETEHGLEVLAVSEQLLPDSADSMAWAVGDFGMHMTLTRDVPDRIASALRPFVTELFAKAGLDVAEALRAAVVAVHPGGPKIIDRVREAGAHAGASANQSRRPCSSTEICLPPRCRTCGSGVLSDPAVAPRALVLSLAFGPGLTVCGGLFRKH